ncbi:MAG TPA: DUF2780 domain-containing protein [Steroidobacteraceae bacterium]|nr:DUF2780 domain-containing protein [Steroidobacteraceae bacterium]
MKELIDELTRQLGINATQAQAGAGLLFKTAQEKLGAGEFQKLLGGVPGIGDLLKLAPSSGGGGLLGGLASALGGNAALLAKVVAGFSKLGLSVDTARQFVPIVLEFLRKHVGPDAVSKIEAALRA